MRAVLNNIILCVMMLIWMMRIHSWTTTGQLSLVSTGCICSGDVLTYECSVVGSGSTVWEGSAFQCSGINHNFIVFRHSQFHNSPEKPQGVCNNGGIVARAIGVVDNNYISQLNVTVSPMINNKTVKCVYDSLHSSTIVGSATITLAAGIVLYSDYQLSGLY